MLDNVRCLILFLMIATSAGAETIEAFGRKWTVPAASEWSFADGILRVEKTRGWVEGMGPRRPIQYAVADAGPFKKATLECDVKRVEGKSLILVYGWQSDKRFNYVHLSLDPAEKVSNHNGVFHVYDTERVRISRRTGPGSLPDEEWHRVKLIWNGATGRAVVEVDGKRHPALEGVDLLLDSGKVGVGVFFEKAWFRNLRIQGE